MFVPVLRVLVAGAATAAVIASTPAVAADAVDRAALLEEVRATSPTSARLMRMEPLDRAKALGRCFALADLRYCLGQGFTERTPDCPALAKAPTSGTRGDLSFGVWAARRVALSDAQRVKVEQAEVSEALEALPGIRRSLGSLAAARDGRYADFFDDLTPREANTIMAGKQTRQERSYWCGPATMQSIGWWATGKKETQSVWAKRLGTTTAGTAIERMVAQLKAIDKRMGRKGRSHGVVNVSDWSASEFYEYHRFWIGWRPKGFEPIIEHPKLITSSFSYLKFNHSGHYQVGRGYRQVGKKKWIQIFEVFNERDYNSRGNITWGPREVEGWKLLSATKANKLHQNIGV